VSEQPAPRSDRPSWWAAAIGALPQIIAALVGMHHYPDAFLPTESVPDYAMAAAFVNFFYGPAVFALALALLLPSRTRSVGLGLLIGAAAGLLLTAGVCAVGRG
jgi:hypothetical protein